MRHMRPFMPALAFFVVGCLASIALTATSGCSGSQRQKTLRAAVLSVNVARDQFLEYDRSHQIGIVEQATSREDGVAKLEAYRKKREPLMKGFEIAYKALALAATANDDPSYQQALAATSELLGAVKSLTGSP